MICNIQLHSLSVIPTPRKYFRAELSIWIRILCPTEGHWASARRRPWSWSKDWVRTRWRVCKLQTAPQTIFAEFEKEVLHFFLFLGIFLVSGRGRPQPIVPLCEVGKQGGVWCRPEAKWCQLVKWQRYNWLFNILRDLRSLLGGEGKEAGLDGGPVKGRG